MVKLKHTEPIVRREESQVKKKESCATKTSASKSGKMMKQIWIIVKDNSRKINNLSHHQH